MFLFLLFIILSSSLYGETTHLLRSRWEWKGESSSLYRISDDRALAELSLSCTRDQEILPDRVILEALPFCLGSYTPAGMWKYISLDTLVSPSLLRERTCVKADRSSSATLERPLIALSLEGVGGVYLQGSQEWVRGALWGEFQPGPYSSLQSGISIFLPDACSEGSGQEGWFETGWQDQKSPLYHLVSVYRQEMKSSRLSVTTALSGARDRNWGYSLLGTFDLYGHFFDWSIRFWNNSPFWLNSSGKRPDWLEVWENSFRFYLFRGFQVDLVWEAAADRYPEGSLYNSLDLEALWYRGAWEWEAGYSLSPPSAGDVTDDGAKRVFYTHQWSAGFSRRGRLLTLSADGDIACESRRIKELSLSCGARLELGPSSTSVSLRYSSVPGRLLLVPTVEEGVVLGRFTLKARASVELQTPDLGCIDPDTINLAVTGEWRSP